MFKLDITPRISGLLENIVRYQSRIDGINLDSNWKRILQERANLAESLSTYNFNHALDKQVNQSSIKSNGSSQDQLLLANELHIRNNLNQYFKSSITVDTPIYLHRYIDNLQDELSEERGKYRKSQNLVNDKILSGFDGYMRYGFIPRIMEDFVDELNNSQLASFIIAPLIILNFISISPFYRSNFVIARLLAKGYLYHRNIDRGCLLIIDMLLIWHFEATKDCLHDGLGGKEELWVEHYLLTTLKAYKILDKEIKKVSGNSISAINNSVIALTKKQKVILDLINKNGQISISELAKIVNVTRQSVFQIVESLLQKGLIDKIGSGTTTRYKVSK